MKIYAYNQSRTVHPDELTTKAAGIFQHGQAKYPSTLMLQLIAAMM